MKKQEPGACGIEGRRGGGVESRQVAVEPAPPQEARLDDMDDGCAEAEGKTDVAEQGDRHVDAEPRESQQDVFGIVKADRHEYRVQEAEKSERRDEQIELAHGRDVLDDESGNHHSQDENGDDEEHVRERRHAGYDEVDAEAEPIDAGAGEQGVAAEAVPANSTQQKVTLIQQGCRQVQKEGDTEKNEGMPSSFVIPEVEYSPNGVELRVAVSTTAELANAHERLMQKFIGVASQESFHRLPVLCRQVSQLRSPAFELQRPQVFRLLIEGLNERTRAERLEPTLKPRLLFVDEQLDAANLRLSFTLV